MNNLLSNATDFFYKHRRCLGDSPRTRFLKILIGLALAGCVTSAYAVKPLTVSGNQILAGGQPASFAGNSLFWSNNGWGGEKFYTAGTVGWLKSDWKSSLVRAAMGVQDAGGYLSDPAGNKSKVKTVVDAAIANDMYAIIDWHSHHAEDNRNEAIAFFQDMARTYGQSDNVIYEIYNEPLGVSWSGAIKPYAQAVISAIRAIDPDNLIIVGTPNWSQDVDVAAQDPITGYANIAYTLHFYAGTHGQGLRDKAQTALNRNIPLFVTEWGSVNADGNGGVNYSETQAWVDFMKARNISNANWSINDKPEGASAVVAGASGNGGWSAGQLTASGANAKQVISGWPGAASSCTTVQLPATVEAENYCSMSGVQTEATTDTGGGSNLGYIDAGDYMSYDVNVPVAGTYTLSYRVASLNGGGTLQLGSAPAINVPPTSGWQVWTTITQTASLPAGKQSLKLVAINGGFNLNWFKIEPVDARSSSSSSVASSSGSSSSAANGLVKPLSVSGNKILAGGVPASFAGNSFYWSIWGGEAYYNNNAISWLKNDWHSQIIRAAMAVGPEPGGYIENPSGQRALIKTVVDSAIANNMYVIVDWHTHHAEDYKAQAIAFFQDIARTYGDKPNLIYEIYNEPLNTTDWHNTIKPYAQDVINAIRTIDPDNLIVVGTQTWSQDVDKAAADPVSGTNIAYTLHYYVGTHGQSLRDKAQGALNSGIALFVTEWGFWGANNSCCDIGEADAWKNFMLSNGISNAGWSLIGFDEPSSHLVSGASSQGGWTSLRPAGDYVKNMIRNWPGNSVTRVCAASGVNATLQAEDYCDMYGIQVEATTDTGGGSNVGYIDTNDWLSYDIDVPSTGYYNISYRVASKTGGGILQLSTDTDGTLGSVNIGPTGDWQTWTTVSHRVYLQAGKQTYKLTALAGGFNINWFSINQEVLSSSSSSKSSSSLSTNTSVSSSSTASTSSSSVKPSSSSSSSKSSVSSSSASFTALIQAEDWEVMSGVQTETTSDVGGGLNVGWLDAGDWISYGGARSINIPVTGTYTVEFRVASQNNYGSFGFERNGGTVKYGTVSVPNTGGYQNWTTVKMTVNLTAGTQGFGIAVNSGGFNINWFRISLGVQ